MKGCLGGWYSFDSADRLSDLSNFDTVATHTRDAVDRLVQRDDDTSNYRYAYSGHTDVPAAVLDTTNTTVERYVSLPGGVQVTTKASPVTRTWSYPNMAGHHVTTTDNAGVRLGAVATYDPFGAETSGSALVDNSETQTDLGAYGTAGKLMERQAGPGNQVVLMGARPFNPTQGRFLAVDPIAGGCANNYVYGYGDPINGADLTGKLWSWNDVKKAVGETVSRVSCFVSNNSSTVAGLLLTAAAVGLLVLNAPVAGLVVGAIAVVASAKGVADASREGSRADRGFAAAGLFVSGVAVLASASVTGAALKTLAETYGVKIGLSGASLGAAAGVPTLHKGGC